ncbi:hypothetical protein KI387_017250, partial [Taxus chinensis]
FEAFSINFIPRKKNEVADRMAAIGVAFDVVESIKSEKSQPYIKVVVRQDVPDNNTSWQ